MKGPLQQLNPCVGSPNIWYERCWYLVSVTQSLLSSILLDIVWNTADSNYKVTSLSTKYQYHCKTKGTTCHQSSLTNAQLCIFTTFSDFRIHEMQMHNNMLFVCFKSDIWSDQGAPSPSDSKTKTKQKPRKMISRYPDPRKASCIISVIHFHYL